MTWNPESPPFDRNRESSAQYLCHLVDADVAAAARTARKQEEEANRLQQAQPKYSEPYPAKGRGKSSGSSQGSSTRPAQTEAARSSYSSYGSYGRSQGYDRGTGITPATVGLSIDLPLVLFQSQTLPTFESRCKRLHLHSPDSISQIRTTASFPSPS